MNATQPEQFTVDYFIKFFRRIPSSKWCAFQLQNDHGQCCALGHLGVVDAAAEPPKAAAKLCRLFGRIPRYARVQHGAGWMRIVDINNHKTEAHPQRTPRARILAALQDLKAEGVK